LLPMDQRHLASTSTSHLPTTSTSTNRNDDERDRRAGPLPSKLGEIGYVDEPNPPNSTLRVLDSSINISVETLSGPHPAERERDQHDRNQGQRIDHRHGESDSSSSSGPSTLPSSSTTTLPLAPANAQSSVSLAPTTTSSINRRLKFLSLSQKSKSYLFGTTPRSMARLGLQLAVLAGTVVGWIFAVKLIKVPAVGGSTNDNTNGPPVSGTIFIHVAFTVVTLIQLLFLERCIFHLRAERWMHYNPTSALPSHLGGRSRTGPSRMPYAPWNRPSLPTYAAALGFRGTGDAEDNEIARVVALGSGDVPPQYGHTRGSTLLAYGIGGRLQMVRGSSGSVMSEMLDQSSSTTPPPRARVNGERPVSYGQSEEIEDALRAHRLEDALSRLEAGSSQGHSR